MALELRKAPGGDPWKGPKESLKRLFELAKVDGPVAIHSFRDDLGDATLEDLIFDLMTTKMREIVEFADPRGCFFKSLKRRAISHTRKLGSRVVESPDRELGEGIERNPSSDRAFALDAHAVLALLSPRDREIAIAAGSGEDRTAIAQAFKTSRANVDQIVSRVRKLFHERGKG